MFAILELKLNLQRVVFEKVLKRGGAYIHLTFKYDICHFLQKYEHEKGHQAGMLRGVGGGWYRKSILQITQPSQTRCTR